MVRLGVTTGAEVPALTGERQEILVGAGVAANPGEAVLQEAAGEELIHDLGDHRAPVATVSHQRFIPRLSNRSDTARPRLPTP